ncbi:MAG: sodium:proton antiporter NhaD [Cyclobacteriaceae bacterium]|nr:sodium:proton antiporter NhaD [Cyclobacteriaceae bacterium]MDH4296041.1 sodium:proton antiporter NhaD [Cyclobacteriaceae bacterium]MDH5249809.1 sodium:proton antiporter NhaD [Cyclobacteriaceae bacterium]
MEIWIIAIFCVGYLLIALEHTIHIDKTATALVTGVLCWTVYILNADTHIVSEQLLEQLGEVSGILFFLMGAMTIVELIDLHDGFEIINRNITTRNRRKLLWIICLLTFVLSPVLDNLTTTIVMVTLCIKLVNEKHSRLLFIGMIIIAANAGGAFSPIGDVTTTMLWIGGQISTAAIVEMLLLPSAVSLLVPLTIATFMVKVEMQAVPDEVENKSPMGATAFEQRLVFVSGITSLLLVPIFKTTTHLPPFMGMMLALGALWILTQLIHRKKDQTEKQKLSVIRALERMDVPSVLFFLGILLAVGVLQHTGQLAELASTLGTTFKSEKLILTIIGMASAVVDNVPIVAATMAMYSLDAYPMDHSFWLLLAYCAGTGGSLLVIGSAAGVAAMGLEDISFGWYLKHIAWLAFLGYISGIGVFIAQESFL